MPVLKIDFKQGWQHPLIAKHKQDWIDKRIELSDNKDEKNIDNVYGQSFLMGYYTEMKDPKNADKTVDELKQIVLKNMVKDVTYYNTKASFGVKDIFNVC